MSYPSIIDLFHPFYQTYSIRSRDLVLPAHFNVYYPDNQDDFRCASVICPAPEKGAKAWTLNKKIIAIGIYRDEGRPTSRLQNQLVTWTRTGDGTGILFEMSDDHFLKPGMKINVRPASGSVLLGVEVQTVISSRAFTITYQPLGGMMMGGTASWCLTNTRATAVNWVREGSELIFICDSPHELHAGDGVDVFNVSLPQLTGLTVHQVYTPTRFSVLSNSLNTGAESGVAGAWQPTNAPIFSEQNYVFRLLPSFKLVPYEFIQELFELTQPDPFPRRRELFDITTQQQTKLPFGKTTSTNYDLPFSETVSEVQLSTRFSQIYDELGSPLPINYRDDGQPVEVNNVDSKFKNTELQFNSPMQASNSTPSVEDAPIKAFDYYGAPINEDRSAPYNFTDLISRDEDLDGPIGNLKRRTFNNDRAMFDGRVFNVFSQIALGVQDDGTLVTKTPILPLSLDRFNKPTKAVGPQPVALSQPPDTTLGTYPVIPGVNWQLVTVPLNNWNGVAYGNGMFVAVATSGQVMSSPDGIQWTLRSAPAKSWSCIAYGAGLFVVLSNSGTNQLLTSPDGINWTNRTLTHENRGWRRVIYAGGRFVATALTGVNDYIISSLDGIGWTHAAIPSNPMWPWGVAYGNGKYVLTPWVSGDGLVATSTDAVNWTSSSTGLANTSSQWVDVVYGNGKFVAVNNNTGSMMISSDGLSWQLKTDVPANKWTGIEFAADRFVAVSSTGNDNRVVTSPDGLTWTQQISAADFTWNDITYGEGKFVAVASSGAQRVMVSGPADFITPDEINLISLVVDVQPTTISVSQNFSVTVTAKDAFGYPAPYTSNITAVLDLNTGGGTLSGTTTLTPVSGSVTYTLQVNQPGQYTLKFSAPGLSDVFSTTMIAS